MTEATGQGIDAAVATVSTWLRKSDLLEAARSLTALSPAISQDPKIATLRSRLLRLYATEISHPLHSEDVPVAVEMLLMLSPGQEILPVLSEALAKGLEHFASAPPDSKSYNSIPDVLDALSVMSSRKRFEKRLTAACVDILERDGPGSLRAGLLANITAKWREIGFEGLPDEVLQRIHDIGLEILQADQQDSGMSG